MREERPLGGRRENYRKKSLLLSAWSSSRDLSYAPLLSSFDCNLSVSHDLRVFVLQAACECGVIQEKNLRFRPDFARNFSFRRVEEDMAAARRGALHILRRPSGLISLTRGSGMAATVRAVATSSSLPSSSSSSPPASSSDSGILLFRGFSASNRTPSWHSSRFFAAEAGTYIPLTCKAEEEEEEEEEEYENDDDDDLLLLFLRRLSLSSSSLVLKEKEKEIMKKRRACMRRCLSLCVYGCWICLLGDCSTIYWSCGSQLLLAVWHLAEGGKRYFLTYTPLHGGCCRGLLVFCATICQSTMMMMVVFSSHSSTKNMIWFLDQWRRNSVSAILGFWSGAVKWFPLLMFSGTSIFFFFIIFFLLQGVSDWSFLTHIAVLTDNPNR